MMQNRGFQKGDKVWKWFDTGALGSSQVVFEVVRENPKTVTVINGFGETIRIPKDDIEGKVDWDDRV